MDEVQKEYPSLSEYTLAVFAAQRAIELRDAIKQELDGFRQEVSDVVTSLCNTVLVGRDHSRMRDMLSHRFIIPAPEPDPLVEATLQVFPDNPFAKEHSDRIRAALDALGFEIREKSDG